MKLIRDQRGELAVNLLVGTLLLTMIFGLFTEYLRVISLFERVEAQLTQAVNVSLEGAMEDSYRLDGRGQISEQSILLSLDHYYINVMKLSGMALTSSDGKGVYRLISSNVSIVEEPPQVTLSCTLELTTMFPFLNNLQIPMRIVSRSTRLD